METKILPLPCSDSRPEYVEWTRHALGVVDLTLGLTLSMVNVGMTSSIVPVMTILPPVIHAPNVCRFALHKNYAFGHVVPKESACAALDFQHAAMQVASYVAADFAVKSISAAPHACLVPR